MKIITVATTTEAMASKEDMEAVQRGGMVALGMMKEEMIAKTIVIVLAAKTTEVTKGKKEGTVARVMATVEETMIDMVAAREVVMAVRAMVTVEETTIATVADKTRAATVDKRIDMDLEAMVNRADSSARVAEVEASVTAKEASRAMVEGAIPAAGVTHPATTNLGPLPSTLPKTDLASPTYSHLPCPS